MTDDDDKSCLDCDAAAAAMNLLVDVEIDNDDVEMIEDACAFCCFSSWCR